MSCSVCLSVWGWNAVDIRGQIALSRRNSFQVSEVNHESRSETMLGGSPWCHYISRANTTAKSAAVFLFSGSGRKWAIFVNLSMMTHSWSYPTDFGSSVMKSIAIDCHRVYGNFKGKDSLYGWCCAAVMAAVLQGTRVSSSDTVRAGAEVGREREREQE